MFKLADVSQKTKGIKEKASLLLERAGKNLHISESDEKPFKLVFTGQYSAGKSSIIKMLTGNDDIVIGAGITTEETTHYLWNNIDVVDTPGIDTGLRPDHDAISYEAIKSADMLVFVVTNELFDTHIANYFRKLAIDKDKAGEMLLVVNKMERCSLGNTQEQQDIIREDLAKVLEPYTTEQMRLTFIDAESYLDSINEEDEEYAEELKNRSGYSEFIKTLNTFVDEKGLNSRLTTSLYEIEGQLEDCIAELQPKSDDEDIDALEENFMQQRHELFDSKNRLQQEIEDVFMQGAIQLRSLGLDASNLITESCNQEEVEKSLECAINDANEIIEKCQSKAISIFNERIEEIGQSIDRIEQSEFSQQLIGRLSDKFERLPEKVKNMLGNAGNVAQKAGTAMVKYAYKPGVQGGLKLANFSGGTAHNVILKAGHMVGYKFKPWQAIKLAKGAAIGGQILGVFGVAVNVFMQIKEDRDEVKIRNAIRDNRQNIRSQFFVAATELENYGVSFVKDNVLAQLEGPIQNLDDNINEIRASRSGKNELCVELESLSFECQNLIREIHSL